jgi:hypothetical protein
MCFKKQKFKRTKREGACPNETSMSTYLTTMSRSEYGDISTIKNIKVALEEVMKAQRRSRGVALLFL